MNDMPLWIQAFGVLCALAILVTVLWPRAWREYERLRVARNRESLAKAGLTPERYMATINHLDYQSYAEAVFKFWPRRDRHERREATIDRIGGSLGPQAAGDIRAFKEVADRLSGRS